MPRITHGVKRTGAVAPFNKDRITNAIYRAAVAVGGRDRAIAESLADQAVADLEAAIPTGHILTVEEIQDEVERVLVHYGHPPTSRGTRSGRCLTGRSITTCTQSSGSTRGWRRRVRRDRARDRPRLQRGYHHRLRDDPPDSLLREFIGGSCYTY